jgi:hypothetical protein
MLSTQDLGVSYAPKKVGCVVGKCPQWAREVPNVLLFIHLTPTTMFVMGSFSPTGQLCSYMFKWPFHGTFDNLYHKSTLCNRSDGYTYLSQYILPNSSLILSGGTVSNCVCDNGPKLGTLCHQRRTMVFGAIGSSPLFFHKGGKHVYRNTSSGWRSVWISRKDWTSKKIRHSTSAD